MPNYRLKKLIPPDTKKIKVKTNHLHKEATRKMLEKLISSLSDHFD